LQLIAATILVFCGALLVAVNRSAKRHSAPEMAKLAEERLAPGDGFAIIFRDRYLMLIAILIVLLNLVNSTGEFLMGDLVSRQAHLLHPGNAVAQKQFVGSFYGGFFANVNLLSLLLQVFAVVRIVPALGARRALHPSRSVVAQLLDDRIGSHPGLDPLGEDFRECYGLFAAEHAAASAVPAHVPRGQV